MYKHAWHASLLTCTMVERMKRMAFFRLSPQKMSSFAVSTLSSVKETTMVGTPKMRDTAKAIAHL